MSRIRERLREPLLALRGVFRNPNLRRIQLAWAGSITGQYGVSRSRRSRVVRGTAHGGATTVPGS